MCVTCNGTPAMLAYFVTLVALIGVPRGLAAATLKWGVRHPTYTSPGDIVAQYNLTTAYLTNVLKTSVVVVPFASDDDLWNAIGNDSLAFVSAGASLTACMQTQFASTPLTTVVQMSSSVQTFVVAGIIFTRANNTDILTTADIPGKTVATGAFTSMSAFLSQWYYLKQKGIDLFEAAAGVYMSDLDYQVVLDVAAGKYAVGFADASAIIELQNRGLVPANSLRVLDPQEVEGFPYTTTTKLYPAAQISATRTTSLSAALNFATALDNSPDVAKAEANYKGIVKPFDVTDIALVQLYLGVLDATDNTCIPVAQYVSTLSCNGRYRTPFCFAKGGIASASPSAALSTGTVQPASAAAYQNRSCPQNYVCICTRCQTVQSRIGALSVPTFTMIVVGLASVLVIFCLCCCLCVRVRSLNIVGIPTADLDRGDGKIITVTHAGNVMTAQLKGLPALTVPIVQSGFHWRALGFADKTVLNERRIEMRTGIRHDNIISCIGHCRLKTGSLQVFLGSGERGTLHHLLHNPSVPMDLQFTAALLMGILEAYLELHSQDPPVCGADIRTHNILLGESGKPMLLADLTQPTPRDIWQAPDVLNGAAPSFASDVYTMGMLLYELIHRKNPFPEPHVDVISELRDVHVLNRNQRRPILQKTHDVEELYDIIEDCWQADPLLRPKMHEVLGMLQGITTRLRLSVNPNSDDYARHEQAALIFARGSSVGYLKNAAEKYGITTVPCPQEPADSYLGMATDKDGCRRIMDLVRDATANKHTVKAAVHVGDITRYSIPVDQQFISCLLGPTVPIVRLMRSECVATRKQNAVLLSEAVVQVLQADPHQDSTVRPQFQKRPGCIKERGIPDIKCYWLS